MMEEQKEFPRPSLTADVVVVIPDRPKHLRVLMIRRAREPFLGAWALPGGFVEPTETVGEAAARELKEETGLSHVEISELGCFSKPGRDPRGWVVTIAHLAVVPPARVADIQAGDDAADAAWLDLDISGPGGGFSISHKGTPVSELAFDHRELLAAAVERLSGDAV